MPEYSVVYMVVYGEDVEADSPEEAAEIVAQNCPYDVDGVAAVTRLDTGEYWELQEENRNDNSNLDYSDS